jgi:hypothetical protein
MVYLMDTLQIFFNFIVKLKILVNLEGFEFL